MWKITVLLLSPAFTVSIQSQAKSSHAEWHETYLPGFKPSGVRMLSDETRSSALASNQALLLGTVPHN